MEDGPTEQVLQRPRTPFAARLAELNLVRGTAAADGVRVGDLLLQGMAAEPLPPGDPAVAAFTPSAVSVYLDPPQGSPRNLIAATVTEVEQRGGIVRIRADDHHGHHLAADVTPHAAAELDLYPGRAVTLSLKATAVTLYPA